MSDELLIDYREHQRVQQIIENIQHVLESISADFDKWDEDYVLGPGLYFAVVSGRSVSTYADPMGDNEWPVDECRDVYSCVDSLYKAAETVAKECDGGIVVSVDGTVQEQMVRFRDVDEENVEADNVEYASWMGSRHMSAVDTSTRPEVVATLTLSEETGRVTRFVDGEYTDLTREDINDKWGDH